MNVDVILTPAELPRLAKRDLTSTVCVVFDVLRATSAFVTALHNGAAAIIPVCEISEALKINGRQPQALLAGERNGVKIRVKRREFDFGNSPREFVPEKVKGQTIVSTTTNGTRALRACAAARTILAGAFLNLSATATFLLRSKRKNVLVVCAGTGENTALEDVLAAGAFCDVLAQNRKRLALSDSARVALGTFHQSKSGLAEIIGESENARRLLAIPELHDDVEFCLRRDFIDLVAGMRRDRFIVISRQS
ncbi:MAG TPA: 2-phosphosulfolactate phosphatase [Verrucomicrobiae bacterium]|nr:2-phosphosulfolactate phosphatase [Verrucomicrobiae bacterium]